MRGGEIAPPPRHPTTDHATAYSGSETGVRAFTETFRSFTSVRPARRIFGSPPDSERLRTDTGKRQARGEGIRSGKGLVQTERREHAAHEPLISSEMVAEVPLAGLSFGDGTITDHQASGRLRPDAGGIGSKAVSLR